MNILIRKNFNAESSGKERSYGKIAHRHRKSHGGVHGNRSRESVFSPPEEHCCSYRTHLFLNTNAGQEYEDDMVSNTPPTKSSIPILSWAIDSIKRRSSVNRTDYLLNSTADICSSRKVSFEDENSSRLSMFNINGSNATTNSIIEDSIKKVEPVTLANLDKDCFIIPIANIDRFLPLGVPVPLIGNKSGNLNVLEIEDPKLGVVIHLISQMEPIEPLLASPLSSPLLRQKQIATNLLQEIGSTKKAIEGILLCDLEKNSSFPFIAYYVINRNYTDAAEFFQYVRRSSLNKYDPQTIRYTMAHTFDLFNEVATIARPPLQPTTKRPKSNTTGYIVTIYKVFEGDDNEKFEKNWLYWTGARMIYRYLPKSAGLRRITLHKSQLTGDKLYLLIVECTDFLQDFSATAILIPALRARLCGYTGIYRSVAVF